LEFERIYKKFMKILIYTGYTNHERGDFTVWADKTTKNKFEYAEKHGYGFLSERNYSGYDRPISWYKVYKILNLLDQYDWIMWMDADSLVMNFNTKIEDIINQEFERQKSIYLSPEIGPGKEPIRYELPELIESNYIITQDNYSPCMGIFLIKNCEWSRNFFTRIYNQDQIPENLKQEYLIEGLWENRGQDYLLSQNLDLMKNIKFVPKKTFNSFITDWTPGDFMIHWPAADTQRRKVLTDEYLKLVLK